MGRSRVGVRPPTLGPLLSYDRYCAEIVAQTDQLRSHIEGADLTVPVPSCPGWNLGQLLRHLGGGHRWVERPLGVLLAWRPTPGTGLAHPEARLTDEVRSSAAPPGPLLTMGPCSSTDCPLPRSR